MNDSVDSQMNFGGINDEKLSSFDTARIIVLPVGGKTEIGVNSIIEASQSLELYEEETDAEVYKIGIHTFEKFNSQATRQLAFQNLFERVKEFIAKENFLCTIGSRHSFSIPIIRAHAEKYYDLSVLQIDSRPDLCTDDDKTPFPDSSVMSYILKDMLIPSVQVGIRAISAEEAVLLDSGLPTKIFWAKDIVGYTDWIDEAINSLTGDVYLTIDVSGLDPGLITSTGTPEPGGLKWYETIAFIRKLAEKRRIVGMDLMGYQHVEGQNAPAFLCAKLIYKTLAFIFKDDTLKVRCFKT